MDNPYRPMTEEELKGKALREAPLMRNMNEKEFALYTGKGAQNAMPPGSTSRSSARVRATMKEQDYIDVTNLAKLRAARLILRDVLAMRGNEKSLESEIQQPLAKWIAQLEGSTPALIE